MLNKLKYVYKIINFIVLFFCCAASHSIAQDYECIDKWSDLEKIYRKYIIYPEDGICESLVSIMKELQGCKKSEIGNNALEFVYSNMGILIRNIESRDQKSTRFAFYLLKHADGAFSEDLSITIGKLIRIDPELFLQEFNSAINIGSVKSCKMSTILGDEFIDLPKAQCREIIKRIESIDSVRESILNDVKGKCKDELQAALNELCTNPQE